MAKKNVKNILAENRKRLDVLFEEYNPLFGVGSPIERFKLTIPDTPIGEQSLYLPSSMQHLPIIIALQHHKSLRNLAQATGHIYSEPFRVSIMDGLVQERLKHDFEFWAATCVTIQDKKTKKQVPFILRKAQRKLLRELEEMRLAGIPIRIILLKARQWGGSTLTQIYMGWIGLLHRRNWHSAIVTDVEDQARNVRGMINKVFENYPAELGTATLKPFEGSNKNRIVEETGGVIAIGSVQKPESLRSFDFAMLHLSEVGLWKTTAQKSAEDLVQSLRATMPEEPYTLEVLESTAKGVGNFFHKEWLAAKNKKSGYKAVFVAWFEIDMYQRKIKDYQKFIKGMNDYDWYLWELGATLEGINWYNHTKTSQNYDDWRMKSEYPSTDIEAFQSTGRRYFPPRYVQNARKSCFAPQFIGEVYPQGIASPEALKGIEFTEQDRGDLFIWEFPDEEAHVSNRYVVSMDIGGKSHNADYSVIKVFDRFYMAEGGVPEVVAVWKGHLDQDLAVWKAVQIAKMYHNALLVVESNSLKKEQSEGDHFLTILDEIVGSYDNIYHRTDPTQIKQGLPPKYGFHTNKASKTLALNALTAALRDRGYYERDIRACDEMDCYEIKPNGTFGAVEGEHDDLVMTTAIGVYVAIKDMPIPKPIIKKIKAKRKRKTDYSVAKF